MTGPRVDRPGVTWPGAARPDRAAVALGAASLVSSVFTIPKGDPWQMVEMPAVAVVVALVLGVAACLGGLLGRPVMARAVGAAFLAAALVMFLELALDANWIKGDASTLSLWAGLGMGLVAAGVAPRDT